MRLFLWLAMLLPVLEALGAETVPCAAETKLSQEWFDQTQEYLSQSVCGTARWFDGFFKDERGEEEAVDRFVRVTNILKWKKNQGINLHTQVNARIQLPQFEEHLNLIFAGEDETPLEMTDQGTQVDLPLDKSKKEANRNIVALRWNVLKEIISAFSLSARMPLNSLNFSLRARYRHLYHLNESVLGRFTETLFWQIRDGFGETSRFDLERLLGSQTLARWSLTGTFAEISEGIDWGSEVALLHNWSPKRAISLSFASWGDARGVDNYRIGLRYRQNIYRPWLFIELEPEIAWPLEEDKRVEGFFFRVEALFGQQASVR